ncbi:MAG TPA: nucleotidyltransferase family protein [Longimicrobiales bacterium]|nr:nucleotidyltransferase family protein [Longimicrobiales bacterium]
MTSWFELGVPEAERFEHAQFHRLIPQFADVDARFAEAARSNAINNLRLFAHLVTAMDAFEENGLEAVAIKGPVLAHLLRSDMSSRMCEDIDILVRREKVEHCARVLSTLGFRCEKPTDASALRRHFSKEHDLQFVHQDGTLLELHADVAQAHYSYKVDIEEWFAEARVIEIGGRRIKTLGPEHTALFAIMHATKHAWSRLDLVRDVSDLARLTVDWRRVAVMAYTAGLARAGGVAAALVHSLTGETIPLQIGAPDRALAKSVEARLRSRSDAGYWGTRWFDLRVRERLSDRLRYVLRLGVQGLQ